MKKRKGQWLLITALIFSIGISTVVLMTSQAKDITEMSYGNSEIYENIKEESQNAINVILSENYTEKHLHSGLKIYLEFLKQYSNEHNSNISGYYIIGTPSGDDLNITVANFLGTPIKNLNISVNSNQLQNLHLNDRNITTYHFSSVKNDIVLNYNFTYTDTNDETVVLNDTFSTKKRVFSILDLKMESPDEIWRNYQIN